MDNVVIKSHEEFRGRLRDRKFRRIDVVDVGPFVDEKFRSRLVMSDRHRRLNTSTENLRWGVLSTIKRGNGVEGALSAVGQCRARRCHWSLRVIVMITWNMCRETRSHGRGHWCSRSVPPVIKVGVDM
jgi:hypothetical protein